MALTPDPAWAIPAKTWDELVERYVRFRRVKAWRGRTHAADGTLNPNRLSAAEGRRVRQRLLDKIGALRNDGILPASPDRLKTKTVQRLISRFAAHREFPKARLWLQDLWRAVLLNRYSYTCCFCRRTAWGTHRELGATLRFELDHRFARARLRRRDDFDLRSICVACRSCNVVKGQMEVGRFVRERRSIAQAVAGHRPMNCRRRRRLQSNSVVHRSGARVARSGR